MSAFADRVIVALDHDTRDEALELLDQIAEHVRYVKIGHRLFTRYGPSLLDDCVERGVEVFLDLKLYDIPSVVGDACRGIAEHPGVFMTTIHASGGAEMVYAAVEGARRGRREGSPKVVAVTALTSFASKELPHIGVNMSLTSWAARLADTALTAGADGVVCSPQEVVSFRDTYGSEPILVTPGIRLEKVRIAGDDQHRVDTPARTIAMGSSYLVIGRPIYQAPEPLAVIRNVEQTLMGGINDSEEQP